MKKIYKYQFSVENNFEIEIPVNAEILAIQTQNNIPCIWALVDDYGVYEKRSFAIYGTGHKVDEKFMHNYIGTFQLLEGKFVGHLFEILK